MCSAQPARRSARAPDLLGLSIEELAELRITTGLYAGVRYVDELANQGIDAYTAVDLNLAWRPRDNLQASLAVQNLNDERHAEFGPGNVIERSAFLKATWYF